MISGNNTIRKTLVVHGQATVRPALVSLQKNYSLSALEFYKIKNDRSKLKNFTWFLFLGWVSLIVTPVINFVQCTFNKQEYTLNINEHVYHLIILFITIVFYILSLFFPSERSKVLKNIESHFTNNPEHQGLIDD